MLAPLLFSRGLRRVVWCSDLNDILPSNEEVSVIDVAIMLPLVRRPPE